MNAAFALSKSCARAGVAVCPARTPEKKIVIMRRRIEWYQLKWCQAWTSRGVAVKDVAASLPIGQEDTQDEKHYLLLNS